MFKVNLFNNKMIKFQNHIIKDRQVIVKFIIY